MAPMIHNHNTQPFPPRGSRVSVMEEFKKKNCDKCHTCSDLIDNKKIPDKTSPLSLYVFIANVISEKGKAKGTYLFSVK